MFPRIPRTFPASSLQAPRSLRTTAGNPARKSRPWRRPVRMRCWSSLGRGCRRTNAARCTTILRCISSARLPPSAVASPARLITTAMTTTTAPIYRYSPLMLARILCNGGGVRYGSVGGLEYDVPQSRLYCLCINVALCSTALQCICRDTKKFYDNESTHILHNFWTFAHRGEGTRMSRYLKSKTNLDFTEARDSEWQCRPINSVKALKAN